MSVVDFVADRWVRIMYDYGASCIWDRNGVGRNLERLSVHPDLIDRMRAWQWEYDSFIPEEPIQGKHAAEPETHSAEGLAIARAVKAALPD